MPYMDPAFALAICRYDLSDGPIKLDGPVSQAYTSVSFYTHNDVAYYAINDRSAGKKVIELNLMTEAQHAELPEDEDVTAADRLIIDSPTSTGLIVMKALAAGTRHDATGASLARRRDLQGADRRATGETDGAGRQALIVTQAAPPRGPTLQGVD